VHSLPTTSSSNQQHEMHREIDLRLAVDCCQLLAQRAGQCAKSVAKKARFGKRRIFPCRLSVEDAKRLRDAERVEGSLEIRKPGPCLPGQATSWSFRARTCARQSGPSRIA
jgi:hypothetical protein